MKNISTPHIKNNIVKRNPIMGFLFLLLYINFPLIIF
ncbi:hypothetical protein [Salmonella phage SD-1_S14]|nr:hypothetical protein [Salmonella phage SD-2_S15]WPK18946.1 hypothetical protein [Salmonella phage SD-6_S16]WPK19619.1 hypothetical protein [Salmonella phage SD-1_S14]WPK20640.1 hypothetical protein [Salmonella phage SD-15_S21]